MLLFYGCWTTQTGHSDSGHYFFNVDGDSGRAYGLRRRDKNGIRDNPRDYVPWGLKVDGTLAPRNTKGGEMPNGVVGFHQAASFIGQADEEWWSCISWWDNSVDSRPGSNCAFLVDVKATPAEILERAKASFPQIFARFKYEVVLPM